MDIVAVADVVVAVVVVNDVVDFVAAAADVVVDVDDFGLVGKFKGLFGTG